MALRQEITAQIKDVLAKNPQGLSITDIVRETKLNRNTAGRYLDKLLIAGQVEMRHFGMAKIYALAHRVPVSAVLSISSELIMQLSGSLRIVFINEAFAQVLGTPAAELTGKNLEYTPFATVFEDIFEAFIQRIKEGLEGTEWSGEYSSPHLGRIFSCRIAPTALDNGQKGVSIILEDVTEQKMAGERLRESEERYRILAETSNDLIFMIGRDDRIEYINSYAAGTLNKKPKDLVGKPRRDLFPGDIADHQGMLLQTIFETGQPTTSESPIPINGELRWYDHLLTPVFDQEGKIRAVFGVSRDITRSREALWALRISEEKFRRIFDDGPLGMSILSPDRRFALVNRRFCEMLGYTKEELLEKTYEEVTHPEYLATNRESLARLYAGMLPVIHEEKQYIKKDGSPLWVSITVTPLRDREGQVLFTISIVEDITERKNAEAELRKSELRFRELADLLPQSVWECDLEGRLTFANRYSFTMYRYTPADFERGLTIWQTISPADRIMLTALVVKAFAGSPEYFPDVVEYTAIRSDNSTFPITMYISPVISSGRITGMRGIGIDKSEIARFETALRESGERFRAIFDSTFQLTGMLTPEGILTEANHAALEFAGCQWDDVVGRPFWEAVWWQGSGERVRKLKEAIAQAAAGIFVRYEVELQGAGGSTMFADFSIKPVYGPEGKIRLLIAEARDITPQKQAEAALKQSEKQLRTLVSMIPDILWQTDAENRFTFVNPQAESVLGYRPEDLVGHEFFRFHDPEWVKKNRETFVAAAAGRTKKIRVISCWLDREGKIVCLESHAAPYFAADGTFAGFYGIDRIVLPGQGR